MHRQKLDFSVFHNPFLHAGAFPPLLPPLQTPFANPLMFGASFLWSAGTLTTLSSPSRFLFLFLPVCSAAPQRAPLLRLSQSVSFSVFPSLSSLHVLLSSTACVASGLFTLCFYYLGKLSQDTLGLNDPHLDNRDALKSQNWLPTTVKTLHFIQEDWQTDGQGLQEVHEYFISPIYSSIMMEVLLTFCNHMSMVKVYWGGKIAKIS